MALLGALCIGLNALGFTNRSLRAQVSQLLGADYTTHQISYDLTRLGINGLIHRRQPPNQHLPASPPTANGLRSSTPRSTTGSYDRYVPPTSHPRRASPAKPCT